jgi:hypothetical protein
LRLFVNNNEVPIFGNYDYVWNIYSKGFITIYKR